jgi:hypothetical protein
MLAVATPLALTVTASGLLATGVVGSLSGFSASITNSSSQFSAGTVVLSENQSSTTCLSTGSGSGSGSTTVSSANANTTCPISLFGSITNASQGTSTTASVTVENLGTINASALDLTPSSCTASANSATSPYSGADTSGFCGLVDVTIYNGSKCVYPAGAGACPALAHTYTLATLAAAGALTGIGSSSGGLSAGASQTFTFSLELDSTATNADQGLTASEPLVWNLNQ